MPQLTSEKLLVHKIGTELTIQSIQQPVPIIYKEILFRNLIKYISTTTDPNTLKVNYILACTIRQAHSHTLTHIRMQLFSAQQVCLAVKIFESFECNCGLYNTDEKKSFLQDSGGEIVRSREVGACSLLSQYRPPIHKI